MSATIGEKHFPPQYNRFQAYRVLWKELGYTREQVDAYLHQQKPTLEWTPKLGFLRDRMLGDLRQGEVELRKKELEKSYYKGKSTSRKIDDT